MHSPAGLDASNSLGSGFPCTSRTGVKSQSPAIAPVFTWAQPVATSPAASSLAHLLFAAAFATAGAARILGW